MHGVRGNADISLRASVLLEIDRYRLMSAGMAAAGRVLALWRYPVSSVGGERIEAAEIGQSGMTGDRCCGLFDPETGEVAAPERHSRWRPALFLSSRLDRRGIVEVGFPNGDWFSASDGSVGERLKMHFGFRVSIGQYGAQSPGSGLPFAGRYMSSPLHLITTSSLKSLELLTGETSPDPRRFRPTILVETAGGVFPENEWVGHRLETADMRAHVVEATKRCGMTLIAQPGIEEKPEILRTIVRHNRRNLGVYCNIEVPGLVRVGDTVYISS